MNFLSRRTRFSLVATAVALAATLGLGAVAHANMLTNGSFEDGSSQSDLTGWTLFGGNGGGRPSPVRTGIQSLKAYGPYFPHGGDGVKQTLSISGGTTLTASVYAQTTSTDQLKADSIGLLQLVFFDSGNNNLGYVNMGQITSSSPTNQWIHLSDTTTAPASATSVQFIVMHLEGATSVGGSVYFDDASLTAATPEPASVALLLLGAGGLLMMRRRSVA